MSCSHRCDLPDAYFDGELHTLQTVEYEKHLENCDYCRAMQRSYEFLRQSLTQPELKFEAPDNLAAEIHRKIRASSPRRARELFDTPARSWQIPAIAAGLAMLVLSSALVVEVRRQPSATEEVTQQVISSHIRSLMANHLTDVSSSQQHTVKPWFAGRLDFAPLVKDLGPQGFALTGGRLDYLNNQSVAALVYKRRQHVINLFLWPSSDLDSGPHLGSRNGYNVVHGMRSHMAYWAVSDLNAQELIEFARDIQAADAAAGRP